jgi:hypothetical protein
MIAIVILIFSHVEMIYGLLYLETSLKFTFELPPGI